jgi:hypothetical protein
MRRALERVMDMGSGGGAVRLHGVPPPRHASDAADPGTVVAGSSGATDPESESPSRMSAVLSAPEAAGAA